MNFSSKIKDLRKEHNLTQEDLAGKLFVTRNAISKWENNKGYPNLESLKLISEIFGKSIDELLSNQDTKTIIVQTNQKVNIIYDYIYMIVIFLSYSFIGILLPMLIVSLDPTGAMAYGLFFGPVSFGLFGIGAGLLSKNIIKTLVPSLIGVIPVLIYYDFSTYLSSVQAIVYFILFFISYILTYFIRMNNIKSKRGIIINSFILFFTFIAYIILLIIGLINNVKNGYNYWGSILGLSIIFIVPLFIETYSLFISIKKLKKIRLTNLKE